MTFLGAGAGNGNGIAACDGGNRIENGRRGSGT